MSIDTARSTDASSHWSRLWETGILHSCATSIRGNYDGAVRAFWQRQFGTLKQGARIVDLGTGNGALLLLARDHAEQHGVGLELHGIDVADVDPARTVANGIRAFAGIRFHPHTSICSLPFNDGEVDLVCSQFGFEYAPRDAAIDEILRVTRQPGRIALVMHSDDSIIAEVAISQRKGCVFLRETCPIIEHARAMIPNLFRAAQAGSGAKADLAPGAERTRLDFNNSAHALMDAIEDMPQAQVLRNAALQIRSAQEHAARSPESAELILRRLEDRLRDEERRLRDLQDALLSPTKLRFLAKRLIDRGYHVEHAPLEQQPGMKIGWSMVAVRG